MAGRLIDGHWFAQDGREPVWRPPAWMQVLERDGYDRETEGEPFFVVTQVVTGEMGRFDDLREAFRFALGVLESKGDRPHPESLLIECRTPSGRCAPVVFGHPLIGMAHGALDAKPIRVIEAPED
jgi:hypothetical protein